MKTMPGNAFIILPSHTKVLMEEPDGTARWVELGEDIKVCTNSQPMYRPVDGLGPMPVFGFQCLETADDGG